MIKNRLISIIKEEFGLDSFELVDGGRFADLAIPPSQLIRLKDRGATEIELVKRLNKVVPSTLVEKIEFEKGFININFAKQALFEEAHKILNDIRKYQKIVDNETVVIDYSGPNIAKPFSVGHLRSTVIGQANLNIHKALGYRTIGVNHIGDWGTQFGKLIYAILNWGDEDEIEKDPITNLNKLYVRFHEEAQADPKLEEEARNWSKKLEDGDEEARGLWRKCIELSFKEFDRIYQVLGVQIENVIGESFYEDKISDVIKDLEDQKLLTESEGARVVLLEGLPPALIQRQDGATLYMTRDLAALKYRVKTYNPAQIIYHVGVDQQLHFRQLEAVGKKLGYLEKTELVFAGHGMMRLPEGKMSTRKGRVILLDDLIQEAESRVKNLLKAKDSLIKNKSMEIAISAIKYADLSSKKRTDIIFSFDKMIDLKGNSAIYLEYTYARMCSLISEFEKIYPSSKLSETFSGNSIEMIKVASKYLESLVNSSKLSEPSILADYTFEFANRFNTFYEKNRIITGREEDLENIKIIYLCREIMAECLDLLGIAKISRL